MFVGYYQEPEKTAEALTADGFVKTGDAGFFEPDGQLKIVDRAKDVGRLANGPAVRAQIYREQAEVLLRTSARRWRSAHGRDFVDRHAQHRARRRSATGPSATASPTPPIRSWPATREVAATDRASMSRRSTARSAREPAMAGAQIRRFLILPKELDADDGELTRTQKVRRRFIAERYAPLVEGLYDGAARGGDLGRDHLRGRPQGPARTARRASSTMRRRRAGARAARA